MKKTYDIHDIDCANCALKVENSLKTAKGVKDAKVDFAKSKVIIESDEEINLVYMNEIAKSVEPEVSIRHKDEVIELNHKDIDIKYMFWGIGITFLLVVLVFEHLLGIHNIYMSFLYITSYLFISYRIIIKAIKNLFKGQVFDEHILMVIATIGALILGEYIEAVAVMVFYQVGEYFQDVAVNRSRKSIQSLLDLKPPVAHKVIKDEITDLHPEDLHIGDIVFVKAGEVMPTDSILIDGISSFDFSSMTGESLPVDSKDQMNLPAGVINLSAPVYVKVEKAFKDSSLQKMIDFVESNSMKKAKAEKFMTKFARYYTPIVVGAALLLAFLVPLFDMIINDITYLDSLSIFVERALIFLVISCPCALVLSIPLSFYAGIGLSSRKGILVKSGSDLETIEQIDHFVFDKTGTLTEGKFSVVDISGGNKDQVLEIAATLESQSTHPIAKSIVSYYQKDIRFDELKDVKEIFGKGLTGTYQGHKVMVSNKKLLDELNISYEENQSDLLLIYVVINTEVIGYITLEDKIKEHVKPFIDALKDMGKKVSLVTGDQLSVASSVGKTLGLDTVYAEVSPEDKAVIVQNLKGFEKVAFLGDGVNDSMVLITADLGISMGTLGSDQAIEASDAVIMNDDPTLLLEAIRVSNLTKKNVIENIILALGIKFIVLILGAFGFANMWMAIFADVGVSLIAVLNAMRLLRK